MSDTIHPCDPYIVQSTELRTMREKLIRSCRRALPAVAAMVAAVTSDPAYAYLDPGTGSILVQGLLAAIAGAAVAIKMYGRRIKSFFTGGKQDRGRSSSADKDTDGEAQRRTGD